jgi:hypothetical protein
MRHTLILPAVLMGLCAMLAAAPGEARRTETVVLIVSDGLRWQEVFSGADPALINEKDGGSWLAEADLRARYWRDDPAARRELLFPFLWGTVAHQGQLFGNQALGNVARVTNGKAFSYPGYNEMTTGFPNDAIDSNEFGPNPTATVFEWLNSQPGLRGRVAVYGTWNVFDNIFSRARSHLVMQTGWNLPPAGPHESPRDALLRRLFATTTQFDEEDCPNSFLQVRLLDYVRTGKPRVLFVGYGETDNWAHSGRYDLVLDSAHRFDGFVRELWETMQARPEYRGKTTFIVTTDHGRGDGRRAARQGLPGRAAEGRGTAARRPPTLNAAPAAASGAPTLPSRHFYIIMVT